MKKEKEHKHKWEEEFIDCPFCGGGVIEYCDCGEYRERTYIERTSEKNKKL
jgi:hypothetical protein